MIFIIIITQSFKNKIGFSHSNQFSVKKIGKDYRNFWKFQKNLHLKSVIHSFGRWCCCKIHNQSAKRGIRGPWFWYWGFERDIWSDFQQTRISFIRIAGQKWINVRDYSPKFLVIHDNYHFGLIFIIINMQFFDFENKSEYLTRQFSVKKCGRCCYGKFLISPLGASIRGPWLSYSDFEEDIWSDFQQTRIAFIRKYLNTFIFNI